MIIGWSVTPSKRPGSWLFGDTKQLFEAFGFAVPRLQQSATWRLAVDLSRSPFVVSSSMVTSRQKQVWILYDFVILLIWGTPISSLRSSGGISDKSICCSSFGVQCQRCLRQMCRFYPLLVLYEFLLVRFWSQREAQEDMRSWEIMRDQACHFVLFMQPAPDLNQIVHLGLCSNSGTAVFWYSSNLGSFYRCFLSFTSQVRKFH